MKWTLNNILYVHLRVRELLVIIGGRRKKEIDISCIYSVLIGIQINTDTNAETFSFFFLFRASLSFTTNNNFFFVTFVVTYTVKLLYYSTTTTTTTTTTNSSINTV